MKVHLFTVKKKKNYLRTILQIFVTVFIFAIFVYGFNTVPDAAADENLIITEKAIRTALVNCYAIEGHFPQSITYLEENYALVIDYKKYTVTYETLYGNVMPSIKVNHIGADADNFYD